MEKQTAGRTVLGTFAPKFAELNDDVLFGEVWAREGALASKTRSIITVSALISKGVIDSSLKNHLENAKKNGVTKGEMAEIITHLAFYAGWPNAWGAFRLALEVYKDDDGKDGGMFGIGDENTAFAQHFVGKSYLKPLTESGKTVFMANVTFEPSCRNDWHIHHAKSGGGQILICTSGSGWYQEWGKDARILKPGDVITISSEVKHWHGASKDSWFSHIAVEVPGEETKTEWCEKVSDEEYDKLSWEA